MSEPNFMHLRQSLKYETELSGKTFRIDTGYTEPFDPFTDFIFFDTQSLKNVSPKKFLTTFNLPHVEMIWSERGVAAFNGLGRVRSNAWA